jgi:hypothetical protein
MSGMTRGTDANGWLDDAAPLSESFLSGLTLARQREVGYVPAHAEGQTRGEAVAHSPFRPH